MPARVLLFAAYLLASVVDQPILMLGTDEAFSVLDRFIPLSSVNVTLVDDEFNDDTDVLEALGDRLVES